jgi:HD-GYP domain-containing protein (c-di-GMP phosphodiesterase class II)
MLDAASQHSNTAYVHSLQVATLLTLFGHAIGLPKSQQILLACGGLLHDVGKLSVGYSVLAKKGQLTSDEWELIRNHVAASVLFLKGGGDMPKGILTIAAQHHERLDGTGYPMGLKANQLNELARMVGIVDVFSALVEDQPYRPKKDFETAMHIMTEEMGGQLDQDLFRRFREIVLDTMPQARPKVMI